MGPRTQFVAPGGLVSLDKPVAKNHPLYLNDNQNNFNKRCHHLAIPTLSDADSPLDNRYMEYEINALTLTCKEAQTFSKSNP